MNFLRLQIRIIAILIFAVVFSVSCDKNLPPKSETYLINENNRLWFPNYEKYNSFNLEDNNLISNTFTFRYKSFYFNEFSSSRFGYGKQRIMQEVFQVEYGSYLGVSNEFKIEAQSPSDGDLLEISLSDMRVAYNFKFQRIERISYYNMQYNQNLNIYNEENIINSTMEYHDSVNVNNVTYYGVLKFELKDFQDNLFPTMITEFLIAKEIGLLRYKTHDGNYWQRKFL